METLKLRPGNFYLVLLVLGLTLALVEYGGFVSEPGALLMTLVFWTSLIQGTVAVVAVAELIGAKWVNSLRRELLSTYPLLLFLAVMFALLWPQLDHYPWADHGGLWLNKPFFFLRNLALLLLSYLTARSFSFSALAGEQRRLPLAAVYLLVFVTSQSLVAFDWVMSLEYPWYSTLFGAYFFVEALYAGFALAAIALFCFYYRKASRNPVLTAQHLRDLALLLFGFSVLWAGLFFAQFLLLWYGNLPEEVGFIIRRTTTMPYLLMAWGFLAAIFLLPFLTLISRRAKGSTTMVAAVALTVLFGMFLEKLLFILPALPMHIGALALQNLLMAAVWLLTLHSHAWLLPQGNDSLSMDR